MFPNHGSISLPPPSLLPGSEGNRSPAFSRYYEAAKTTRLVGRHSVCHVALPYLGLISSLRSPPQGNRCVSAWVLVTGLTHLRFFVPEDAFGPPRFPENPAMLLPCSQIPAGPRRLANLRRFGAAPVNSTTKAPATNILSRLNHTALAFAVYASCRPFGRRRKTRFRWWLVFSGWDCLPTEFFRAVSAAPSPAPGLFLARGVWTFAVERTV
jgi:hypothetical protein